jgi:dihydroxyacid dehydratase/phosphogluconate dehydratase
MPETYQVTSALKFLPNGKRVTLLTDGRFSGVSTGACIGHISPEARAGGPIGRVRDGDRISVRIDTLALEGSVDLAEASAAVFGTRPLAEALTQAPAIPADTLLWAALQNASGGSWGGCVYDPARIAALLEKGLEAERASRRASP